MSHVSGLTYACDRCDADLGNADITQAITVSDLDPDDTGAIRVLHFCRENGCDRKVLSPRNLAAYLARKESDG